MSLWFCWGGFRCVGVGVVYLDVLGRLVRKSCFLVVIWFGMHVGSRLFYVVGLFGFLELVGLVSFGLCVVCSLVGGMCCVRVFW